MLPWRSSVNSKLKGYEDLTFENLPRATNKYGGDPERGKSGKDDLLRLGFVKSDYKYGDD